MSKQRSFRLSDGRIADIPDENVSKLLELDPKAVEVKSFLLNKDTVDISIENSDKFIKLYPEAKPLYQEEPSIGESMLVESAQKPFGAPEPSVPDNIDFASTKKPSATKPEPNIDFKANPKRKVTVDSSNIRDSILKDEATKNAIKVTTDNFNADNSKLKTQDKQALNTVMPTMPLNVLTNRKSREVFYNTYASKQKLNVADVREYGERVTAQRVLQLAQDALSQGDLESAEALANSQLKTRNKDAKAIIANIAIQYDKKGDKANAERLYAPLAQVGTGSYRQPSYTAGTIGGKQGFTIEGENTYYKDKSTAADKMLPDALQPKVHSYKEITPDTQPTATSKYLTDIASALRSPTDAYGKYVIDPASEMMKHGAEKLEQGYYEKVIGETLHGYSNNLYGLAEMAMGAAGIGTLGGQAFTAGLTGASEVAPEATKVALWGTNYLAPYLQEKYGWDETQAANAGLTADILTAMILHAGYTKGKGLVKDAQAVKSIKGMTPAEMDAEAVKILNSVPKEEFHKIVDESVSAFKADPEAFQAKVENNAEEISNHAQEARDIEEGLDAHANTTDYQPIPHPESLGAIPEGYDVEYQGRKGTIDRGDDGTWYFNDDATGQSEQIPVKDKFNPQETLNDLGIQILPEVPQEQVAKAMADAERTGWVEEKGKRYFVSLGNPKIEGSYDMVFEQTPDGKLVNRFDSHPDQTFAQNRKLKIANKLLEEQGLPKRESLRAPRQSEPTSVVESAVTEPVSEAKAVEKVTADTEPTPENSIYYHATDNDHIIAPGEEGYRKREGKNVVDQGIYFGKDKEHLTDRFGKNAIKVSLDIKNPLISDNQYIQVGSRLIDCLSLSKDDIKFLKRKGYDAVHLRLAKDGYYAKWNETIVFDKSQIKQLRVEPADPITPQVQETPSVEAAEVVQEPAAVEAAEITPTEENSAEAKADAINNKEAIAKKLEVIDKSILEYISRKENNRRKSSFYQKAKKNIFKGFGGNASIISNKFGSKYKYFTDNPDYAKSFSLEKEYLTQTGKVEKYETNYAKEFNTNEQDYEKEVLKHSGKNKITDLTPQDFDLFNDKLKKEGYDVVNIKRTEPLIPSESYRGHSADLRSVEVEEHLILNDKSIKKISEQPLLIEDTPKAIAEAYHKAKADGSNPELVKAVDELLNKKEDAIQEPKAAEVLSSTQEGNRSEGSERMEPSEQGETPAAESTEQPLTPKQEKIAKKNEVLKDIRQYNSIPKRERATVGAKLKAKIEAAAKEIGHTVAFDSKSRLSMFDAKGKKVNASPRVISAEERQMKADRKAAVREAMKREPNTIREYLLQYLLKGNTLSAESVMHETGYKPSEFANFTVSKDGKTLHDFMEMMDNGENEHLLREFKDGNGVIDTQRFNDAVMGELTSLSKDRGKLWEDLLNGNKDNVPDWKKEGFQDEAQYEYAMELQKEAEARGLDISDIKQEHEDRANGIVDLLTDEEVDAILKDLDERSPKTEQEINQFYEDHDINTETEVSSETNNTERNKGNQTAEKELADAKQALIDKRAELTKALMEDQENLFGERKSSEGTLIDERADASQVEKALEPYKQAVEEAKAKLAKVEETAKGQTEISDNGGKTAEFNHAGQARTGVIVGEEGGKYIIESKVGNRTNTYKIPKEKTTVLEDKSVEEILQARKNLSNIGNSTSGIAFRLPSDMFDSVGKSLKKLFNNTGGLPRKVFGFKVGMEGAKAATMFDIKVALNKLDSSVKTSYGKKFNDLTATEVTKMDKYLKGDTTVALPTDVKIALDDMRNQVDALSRELIASGLAEGDLALTIDKNLGTYLTRSYRAFDDPNWAKTVPESIRNQAKGYLRNEYPLATPAEIDGIIESLLYKPDAPIQILSGGKVGAKDLSIFKKRGDIPFEIRQLLGEYSDPKINYAKSVFKMAGLIEHSKFLEKTYQEGLNNFLFEKPTGQFHVQIAADTNKAYNPLSGLYTTPELADAFNQVKSVMKGDDLWNKMFRSYMTVNAAIKAGKTIGSVQTHVRNVLSNINFVVANAHIMYPEGAKKAMSAIKTMWKEGGTQEQIDYVKKLQRYGILDDGASAMELSETIKDASKKYSDVDQLLQDNVISKIKKGTVKAYALEDAMYKVFAFEAEKTRYEEAGVPDAEAIAARNVRNLYPTYSLTPEIVKQLRRVPLMGTFVSFPAEVIRTYANTWQLAAQEMRNPQTRSIGIKRVAGLIAATVLTKAISQQSRKLWNVSQQEEKDLRRFQPPWSEASDYVYVGRDKQNVPVYVDLGYSDPYNYLKNPINSIMFNEDQGEGAIKGFYNLVQPFISEEMLSSRMIDISRNKKSNGGQIYNEQDLAGDKLAAAWSYLADVAEPGTLGSIRRIYKGYKGEESDYGKKYDVDTEILAMMTGQRINNTNVKSALSFKTYSFSKDMQEAKRIYNSVAYKTKDKDEIEGAYIRANEARQKIYDKYVKLYNSALKLGMTQKEIKAVMKENNISGEMVRSIMANDPYKAFEKKVIIK